MKLYLVYISAPGEETETLNEIFTSTEALFGYVERMMDIYHSRVVIQPWVIPEENK